jgi:S1-C subfamily serine protease
MKGLGKRAAVLAGLATVLPVALPLHASLEAQEPPRRAERAARPQGWIGITFDLDLNAPWQAGVTVAPAMVISRVYEGSPAARVGLQVGDSIIRINQRLVSQEVVERLQAQLQPGSGVSFQIRRAGRLQNVALRADSRPSDEELEIPAPQMLYRVQSAQAVMLQHMDSAARLSMFAVDNEGRPTRTMLMLRTPGDSLVVTFPASSGPLPGSDAFDRTWTIAVGPNPAPFEGVIASARPQPPAPNAPVPPRARLQEASARTVAMQVLQGEVAEAQRALATLAEHRRPLAPYTLGQDVIAGAKLAPLNPGLADYFGIARGLLVVAVLEDTPAADAGVLSGDVIVASGSRGVSTVEELRAVWTSSRGGNTVPLTLVRKGQRVTVSVPR